MVDIKKEEQLKEEAKTEENKKEESKKEIPCEERLKKLEAELKEWKERALRYAAEVENLKRIFKREKEEYYKFALENVFKEILPSIDNLERSLDAFESSQNLQALKEGVELTLKILITALEKFGLKQFEPALGDKFEPYIHEALSTEPHPEIPNGAILKVYQKGYKLHDRVIRPALVSVSTGKPKEETCEKSNSQSETEAKNQENKN